MHRRPPHVAAVGGGMRIQQQPHQQQKQASKQAASKLGHTPTSGIVENKKRAKGTQKIAPDQGSGTAVIES